MKQPLILHDKRQPKHVCKLRKAIYDLRQAPRAWYSAFSSFLIKFGLINSITDKSLFIFNSNKAIVYILVYVDNIIITRTIRNFWELALMLYLKDFRLRTLKAWIFFLGIEILDDANGLLMSKNKYIMEIMEKTYMLGAKAAKSPMTTSTTLSLFDGTTYRRCQGIQESNQVFAIYIDNSTNISFLVNKLAQYMHKPTSSHFLALKRVLRYLKGTLDRGIRVSKAKGYEIDNLHWL